MVVITFVAAVGPTGFQDKRTRSAPDGQKIFQQCSGCHSAEAGEKLVGPSLKGLFKKRELLSGTPANERSIRLRITKGGDGMPPYGRLLSAKELDQLVEYLKTL
jgi:cytochrome c